MAAIIQLIILPLRGGLAHAENSLAGWNSPHFKSGLSDCVQTKQEAIRHTLTHYVRRLLCMS